MFPKQNAPRLGFSIVFAANETSCDKLLFVVSVLLLLMSVFMFRTMPQAWCPSGDAPAASPKGLKVFTFKLCTLKQAWCQSDDAPAASPDMFKY